jgi:hypothetical protein
MLILVKDADVYSVPSTMYLIRFRGDHRSMLNLIVYANACIELCSFLHSMLKFVKCVQDDLTILRGSHRGLLFL